MKIIPCLQSAPISLIGEFTWGSNATYLVALPCDEESIEAVYKPLEGEQPLWDFPPASLAGREVAAFLLSQALGWGLVLPTVFRENGPLGPGSLQWRVPHIPERHYFTFSEEERQKLRPATLLDILANNADRKAGHILIDQSEKIWLIDQGLCFHSQPKLRTVIWDFMGESIPSELLADMKQLKTAMPALRRELAIYLAKSELDGLESRLAQLINTGLFPFPPENERALPFPLV